MKYLILTVVFLFIVLPTSAQGDVDSNGYNIFYYENGQVSSEGNMRDGKPDGYWKTYYKNGIIKSEGNRKDFMLDSVWTFYNDSAKVAVQITYLEDKKNGIRRTYHEEEIVEENFVNDVKQGFTYHYNSDGKLWKEVYFIDGLEEGIGHVFAKNDGRVMQLIYHKKGYITDIENINRIDNARMKQGRWITFYEDWQIHTEGEYKNDLKHGYFKEYSKDGVLLTTSKYIDGILQEDVAELAKLDIKTEYYPNGNVKIVASYKDDVPQGVRREFSEEGVVVAGYIFRDGNIIGEGIIDEEGIKDGPWKEYYPNGVLKSIGTYDKGNRIGGWKFYYPNEQLEQIGFYNKDGKADGSWTWYYSTGDLLRQESYFNGMIDGFSIEYDEYGVVIAEGEYIEDYREGEWKYNYGDHKSEGEYSIGMRHGKWKSYYSDGILNFEGEFIEDNPNGRHTWYWPDGTKKTEGNYIMGLKDKEWIKYNYDGTPFISITYENGVEKRYDGIRVKIIEEEEDSDLQEDL